MTRGNEMNLEEREMGEMFNKKIMLITCKVLFPDLLLFNKTFLKKFRYLETFQSSEYTNLVS